MDPIPNVLPEARGVVALNRAFLAVADKRPAEALTFFEAGAQQAAAISLPDFGARITMLNGLVAWSGGDVAEAEKLFRAAIAALPGDEGPHFYLAQLRAAKGDAAGAAPRSSRARRRQRIHSIARFRCSRSRSSRSMAASSGIEADQAQSMARVIALRQEAVNAARRSFAIAGAQLCVTPQLCRRSSVSRQ